MSVFWWNFKTLTSFSWDAFGGFCGFFLRLLLFSNPANQVSRSTKKQGIVCVLTTKQCFQPTPSSCLSVRVFEQCHEWLACEFGTAVCEEVLAWGCTENRKRWILAVREICKLILCCHILSVSSAEVAHAAAPRVCVRRLVVVALLLLPFVSCLLETGSSRGTVPE